ncbi:hypothetical protein R84B8_01089 [Treponema sp. R8-4-B8]
MKNQIIMKLILVCVLLFVTAAAYAQTEPLDNEDYEDFSSGQRWGTWALNAFVLPGLGSYAIMHDKVGGTTQLITGIVSRVLVMGSYVTIMGNMYGYSSSYSYSNDETKLDEQQMMIAYIALAIGGVLSTVNDIYNIIRSATYHKPHPKTALFDPSALNIVLLPTRDGKIDKVQLSYIMRF